LDAGLAVNLETGFEECEPWLDQLDLLLVMTVHPGFGGQSFMSEAVPKIARARHAIDTLGARADLEVDGGIDPMTAPVVVAAGARLLVAGSAIFGHDDPVAAARQIRQSGQSALAGGGLATPGEGPPAPGAGLAAPGGRGAP
ncbi:MAG: ribulose-phosphate 3-epimerase, partial [Acidimicrobiales bacterium]